MNGFKQRFMNFMADRYGVDDLAKDQSKLVMVLVIFNLLLSFFSRFRPVSLILAVTEVILFVLFIHLYFRVFSRNISKRYNENLRYTTARYKFFCWFDKKRNYFRQRKNYRFFKCPMCSQKVRVPKGHGKVSITCPKCREEFIRRS